MTIMDRDGRPMHGHRPGPEARGPRPCGPTRRQHGFLIPSRREQLEGRSTMEREEGQVGEGKGPAAPVPPADHGVLHAHHLAPAAALGLPMEPWHLPHVTLLWLFVTAGTLVIKIREVWPQQFSSLFRRPADSSQSVVWMSDTHITNYITVVTSRVWVCYNSSQHCIKR